MEEVLDSISVAFDSLQLVCDSLQNEIVEYKKTSDINSTNINRTLISSGIIILLFLAERLMTYFSNRSMKKIEFFQEIIVKPNLEKITKFYTEFYEKLQGIINEIRNATGTNDSLDDLKSTKLEELKMDKIRFDLEFLSLVRSANLAKYVKLSNILNQIEDLATEILTNSQLSSLDLLEIEKEIYSNKASFFEELNKL